MAVSADKFILRIGIGFFQCPAAETPGGFFFGIEEDQTLLEVYIHGWVIKGHAGICLPFQRLVAHGESRALGGRVEVRFLEIVAVGTSQVARAADWFRHHEEGACEGRQGLHGGRALKVES